MKQIRKICAFLLCAALLFGVFSFTVPQTAFAAGRVPRMGDVVYDGFVTAEDARICLRAAVDLETLNATEFEACDIDADGELTAGDAREILRFSVGLDSPEISANRVTADDKILYLTFDDGPSRLTQKVLDILERHNAKATFFVVNSDTYAYQYKNIVDHGHSIGLHSYTHDYSDIYRSVNNYFADLNRISDKVFQYTGIRSKLIRFPGGSSNTVSRSYRTGIMSTLTKEVEKRGYVYFDWNGANNDAAGINYTSSQMYRFAIASNGKKEIVMLMHDAGYKENSVASLESIVEFYQSQGYVLMALHENSFTAHHKVAN